MKYILGLIFVLLLASGSFARAQNLPEVTVKLNEAFLNSFLDAIFTNLETPKFELAKKQRTQKEQITVNYDLLSQTNKTQKCDESIVLLRENDGVKTSIRFVNKKIMAPLAFTGTYNFPFVGCSNFRGIAEADLNLSYDRAQQTLFGRVKVTKVDLNGVPGVASGLVARLVQNSIDSRVNPIEILRTEQVSAVVPVKYANGSIRLRAINMIPEIIDDSVNVRVVFEFAKAN
jgi:hypothetical protein